ncbi:hypothetical protein QUF80_24385 [Desulfococcaceae bacterium HSG8]|nr:hypothetical protein [Desulfococcaceae bacterium HSG8]
MTSDICPPWGKSSAWLEANQTMAHLIRIHGPKLGSVTALALEIREQLESVFPLLDDLCMATCPWCPDSCCLRAAVWMDFRDLLFLHLIGQEIPQTQLMGDLKQTCRYLGSKGCSLPRISRSWTCIRYLCPTQMAGLRKKSCSVQEAFDQSVQIIRKGRKEMEKVFIRVIYGDFQQ